MRLFLFCHLRHDDGGSDGGVERFRRAVADVRNGDGMGDALQHLGSDAVRLAPDDDDAFHFPFQLKQAFPFEQGSVDGFALPSSLHEENGKVSFRHGDPEHGAHRGLDDFRVPNLDAVGAAYDFADAEPFRRANDGAHVARVGDAVQGQDKSVRIGEFVLSGDAHHGEDAGRRVLTAHLLHLHLVDGFGGGKGWMVAKEGLRREEVLYLEIGVQQFLSHFTSFHDEEPCFLAELLLP